jgi:hypothetical protein
MRSVGWIVGFCSIGARYLTVRDTMNSANPDQRGADMKINTPTTAAHNQQCRSGAVR